jgi:hypothetical protein
MKKILMIVGILIVVLLAVGAGGYFYITNEGKVCDASSRAYVDECVPAIVSNWSKDELAKRESPELHEAITDDQLNTLFTKLSGLGPMQSYDGATGKARVHLTKRAKFQITADYVAQATFPGGKAQIKLNLIQIDGTWMIQGFGIVPASP